jgi:hypothetical protein
MRDSSVLVKAQLNSGNLLITDRENFTGVKLKMPAKSQNTCCLFLSCRHSSRNGNDRKELTHRTSRHSNDTDSGEFKEIAYPAFSNHGYHGYQGYPTMYVDPQQDLFANYIPKRVSWSSRSDPTRDHEYDQRRHNRHSADVYIHSQT